jgi:hypothetical protein
MSTHADTNDGTDFELPATAADDEASRADLLDALLAHLDGLAGVDATEVDAHCCGALGCTRTESRLWRVDVDGGRRRTLCPTHAVDFTRKESGHDV